MECTIYISKESINLCCICLDECFVDEYYAKKSHENSSIKFKCCGGYIHNRCLLLLFLNDFENCCLCRNEIDVLDYYTVKDIQKFLHINELKDYKEEICKLLYKLSFNIVLYCFYICMFNIEVFFNKLKYYIHICILDIKISIKELLRV